MKCSMCGYEYEANRRECRGCIRLSHCSMTKCPRCGYEEPMPVRFGVIDCLKRKFSGGE